jgi:hypothetical protein
MAHMDRVDLRFPLGNVVIGLTEARLYGGLATHQLRIAAKVSATWLDDKASEPLLLAGRVSSDHQFPHHVGDLAGDVLGLRGFAVSEDLCVSLSDEQVHALDKERAGGALRLRLDLKGTLLAPPPGIFPTATSQVPVRIPESSWTQDLDQLGKVLGLSIRVPAPLVDPGGSPPPPAGPDDDPVASRAQAVARLREARSELADGRYESCAATCRLVLESLDLLEPVPSAHTVFDKKPPERTQPERWAAIHHDLHSLLSGAHHDGRTTRDFIRTREDAETALVMAGSLAARAFTR